MKLARQLNILGYTFDVVDADLGTTDAGCTKTTQRLIQIDKSMHDSARVETLYHEVVHAMLDLGGFELGEKEEPMVQFLGMALAQFLSNNEGLDVLHPSVPTAKEETT